MRGKDVAELKASLNEVLDHARDKIPLRTRDVPTSSKVTLFAPEARVNLRRKRNAG